MKKEKGKKKEKMVAHLNRRRNNIRPCPAGKSISSKDNPRVRELQRGQRAA